MVRFSRGSGDGGPSDSSRPHSPADSVGVEANDHEASAIMPLAGLAIGQAGTVVGLAGEADNGITRRLRDLGFLAGTRVIAVRRAPLGEPTIYELRGYQMSLRRSESQRILIEPAPTA